MSPAAVPRHRPALVSFASFASFASFPKLAGSAALALLMTTAASAAPTDANHRFERIGFSIGDVAAVLPMPGEMRSIVVTRDGQVYRVAGNRHVVEHMGAIPANISCPTDGVLGVTMDPANPDALFAVYTATGGPTGRVLRIARFDILPGAVLGPEFKLLPPPSAPTQPEIAIPDTAGCTNLGGGIAVTIDGNVLFGVGDMGTPSFAGQPSSLYGKIMRVAPTGGVAPGNPNPASPTFASGVRDPRLLATDRVSNFVWFIDRGETQDEVNWISGPSINFAWPRATGNYLTAGYRDPAHTFAASIGAVGLAVNNGTNFGSAWNSDVIITTATATVHRLDPIDLNASPPSAAVTTVFTPGTGEPGAMAGTYVGPDGYIYLTTPGGEFYRLRNENSLAQEPSDRSSIIPTLVRKSSGGGLEILTERETQSTAYGFYPGSIGDYYSHYDPANPLVRASECLPTTGALPGCITPSVTPGSAWATLPLSPTQVSAMPENAYFVLSTINDRGETAVGFDSELQVLPGGLQTFGCPCPPGVPIGPRLNQCGPNITVAEGIEGFTGGVPNVMGPYVIPEQYQCQVIMLDLSAEWCPPCRAMAVDAEGLYQQFKDRGFVMIHALDERNPRGTGPCDLACAERWSRDFGTTFPVLADGTAQGWDFYNLINAWPQSLLISRDGIVVRRFDGSQPRSVLESAIEAEVSR